MRSNNNQHEVPFQKEAQRTPNLPIKAKSEFNQTRLTLESKDSLQQSTSSSKNEQGMDFNSKFMINKDLDIQSPTPFETESQADESSSPQVKCTETLTPLSKAVEPSLDDQQNFTKKASFSVVCMLPQKQNRGMKSMMLTAKKDPNYQIIEREILDRILQSQQEQLIRHQNPKLKPALDLRRIGLCGIPSLWMQEEELIKENYVSRQKLSEKTRLDQILRVLQIHKKYENEKYFGGGLRKGQQSQSFLQGALINPDFIQFNTDTLIQRYKGSTKDEKISGLIKDESNGDSQSFSQIRNLDNPEQLLFKILQAEAKLVRMILESHGFIHTESNDWNILWTCTASQQKNYMYEALSENQKINHFINSSELTRKDRFCFNVGKCQQRYGKNHFDFIPETFILPDEFSDFYKRFNQIAQDKSQSNVWIVKPSSSSQGKGIFMVSDVAEVPLNESLVISRYIQNPLLINGLKFDLRLYVLVTSFEPLKIYVYNEGLVRFASEQYDMKSIKSNAYAHLTNYSINKKSENFIQNQSIAQRDVGNKWSLSALQTHLQKLGINMSLVWERIYDAIIKSILSVEPHVISAMKKVQLANPNNQGKQNCFDLFGFDIILDEDLKPWVLEVNLSPSLAFDSPLDFHIKSNLLVDTFNIVGIKKIVRKKDFMGKPIKTKPTQQSTDDKKRYQSAISSQYNQSLNKTDTSAVLQFQKQNQVLDTKNTYEGIDLQIIEKISKVSAKNRELLRDHLEEFTRNKKENYTRIFPAPGSNYYDQFFEQPRSLNKLLYKYLYQENDLQDILSPLIVNHQSKTNQQSSATSLSKTDPEETHNLLQQKSLLQPRSDIQERKSSMSNYVVSTTNLHQDSSLDTSKLSKDKLDKPSSISSPLSRRKVEDKRSSYQTNAKDSSLDYSSVKQVKQKLDDRVVITGDDILIEYVKRVMQFVRTFQNDLSSSTIKRLESFLNHKVWNTKSQQQRQQDTMLLWQRIEVKYLEMQARKKRLFMKKYKDDVSKTTIEEQYAQIEAQKGEIIKEFSSNELEKMLIQSNSNNQIEVVSILLCGHNTLSSGMTYGDGILTKLEKESTKLSKNSSQLMQIARTSVESSFFDSDSSQIQEKSYATPTDMRTKNASDKVQMGLMRMKTSDEKGLTNPFNYKTQQNIYEQLHNSYSQSKAKPLSKNTILYQSSNTSSNQNILKLAPRSNNRDYSQKPSDKRLTLPQINNHLSQDYSKVSVQMAQGLEANDKNSQYRSRMGQESSSGMKMRQQSLQNDHRGIGLSKFAKQKGEKTKFERLEF